MTKTQCFTYYLAIVMGDTKKPLVLKSVKKWFGNVDGKRTRKQLGFQYTVAPTHHRDSTFIINIAGDTPAITQSEIKKSAIPVMVSFAGYGEKQTYYTASGREMYIIIAEQVTIVPNS